MLSIIIPFLTSLIIIFISFFVSRSLSAVVLSLATILFGILLIKTIEEINREKGYKLLFIVFSFYALFALFHYLGFCYNYENFAQGWRDEFKFFIITEGYKDTPISEIFKDCFINKVHLENEGYIFYIASLSSIAQSLFDGNHLLYQFLGTTLFGILSSILLYKFLLLYINKENSYKYALIFMLCSAVFQYSFFLLRDIIIFFFYLLGFIIISKKFSVKGLFILICLNLFIWQLRYESGLFFIVFILYYFYINTKRYKTFLIIAVCILAAISFPLIKEHYNRLSKTLTYYSAFTETAALGVDDSLGKTILKLPFPLKEIGILINSQMQPFPPWYDLLNSNNIFEAIVSVLPMVYSFFWFIVAFSLIKWLIVDKRYKNIRPELILLAIVGLVFLLGNIANMALRRIMCVYPIFYLLYTIIRTNFSSKQNRKKTMMLATSIYITLLFIYLSIKYA